MRSLSLLAAIVAGCAHAPARPKVIVISLDGLMPEVYLDPDAHGLRVPTLRALAARGEVARVESVLPTSTYPAHATLVTGVTPAAHGITTNRAPDPLAKNLDGYRWYAEDFTAPTLWDRVEAEGRTVGLVTWPTTVGADVTYLVPEIWRAGTADDQKLVRAMSTPGLLDAVERESPALWEHFVLPELHDEAPFAIARHLVDRVDLLMVHAWEIDDAQHAHGPWSAEAVAAIEGADALLGELVARVDLARTFVVIVSDHGFEPVHTQVRLNALFVERGLITLDGDGKPTAARVTLAASGGTAYLYLEDPSARAEVEDALAAMGDAVANIIGPPTISELGGDPTADYLLVAAPGHQFSERRVGPIVLPSSGKGDHGMLPANAPMLASYVAVGPGITRDDLGTITLIDVANRLDRFASPPP